MKTTVVATIVLAVAIYFAPQGKAEQRPGSIEKHAQADTRPDGKRPAGPDYCECPTAETEAAKKNPPHWYKSPEWVLVIVGIVTCIVIGYQSYATWCAAQAAEKAAEATRDSVKLQEIVQQQWVQIDGWRREGEGSYEETPPRFAFAMEVSNPTDVPLTVESVSMTVSAVTIASKVGNVLGPGDPIKVSFPMTIKPDQMAAYKAYRLVTVITGFVVYVDAFKNKKTQPFGQSCTLGPKHFAVFSPLEMPTPQEQNPGQNPN